MQSKKNPSKPRGSPGPGIEISNILPIMTWSTVRSTCIQHILYGVRQVNLSLTCSVCCDKPAEALPLYRYIPSLLLPLPNPLPPVGGQGGP